MDTTGNHHDVFLSYAREDGLVVQRIYDALVKARVSVFFDRETILPGQRWKSIIRQSIRNCKYFIAVLSNNSVRKRGYVQKELREALEVLDEYPEDGVYVIPVRIEDCRPSHSALEELSWVDLFDDFDGGLLRIMRVVKPAYAKKLERRILEKSPPVIPTAPDWNSRVDGSLALSIRAQTQDIKERLQSRLNFLSRSSAYGALFVRNLREESSLSIDAMTHLIHNIAEAPQEESVLSQRIAEVCRQHILSGKIAKLPASIVLGTVSSYDDFVHHVYYSNSQTFPMLAAARDFVGRFVHGYALDAYEKATLIKRFIVWATFDLENHTSPFADVKNASTLACEMGYARPRGGERFLAFEYSLPLGTVIRVPTVCDIYAVGLHSTLSQVPPPHAMFGMTIPQGDCLFARPRVEVVHAPVQLNAVQNVRLFSP